MAELRAQLITDKGGEESVSTAERILIDLVVDAYFKKQSVAAFLLTLPSLVDKRHRGVWRVVRDDVTLGNHLQSLLRDLGLERRTKDMDIAAQLAALHQQAPSPPSAESSLGENPHNP